MDNSERISRHLRRREAGFVLATWSSILIGLVASLSAAFVIVAFVATICRLWHLNMMWWVTGLAAIIVTVPALYRLESRAQGAVPKDLEAPFLGEAKPSKPATSPAKYEHLGRLGEILARPRTPISGLVEFFLIGPNLVIRGKRRLRFRRLSRGADFARVVAIMDVLSKLQSGAATEKLQDAKETPAQLSRALAYLLFFDWVGIAGDGGKVWILTEARRELAAKPV